MLPNALSIIIFAPEDEQVTDHKHHRIEKEPKAFYVFDICAKHQSQPFVQLLSIALRQHLYGLFYQEISLISLLDHSFLSILYVHLIYDKGLNYQRSNDHQHDKS